MTTIKPAARLMAVAIVAFLGSSAALRAEEASPEKIKALVKDLGDEDFAKRTNAEKELAKVGVKAVDALKMAQASADPQVKATAGKLLGRIRLANLPPVDFLEVAPATSIVALQFKSLGLSLDSAKGSAIGKLILSAAMAPFRAKLDAAMSAQPDVKKKFLLWSDRFKGQIALAVWELKLQPPEEIKVGGMLEITDPDPQNVFEELIKQTNVFEGGVKTTLHKDVEILQGALGFGPTLALVGKNLLVGPNVESVAKLVDGFLAPGGLAGTVEFKKAKPSLGAKPEMLMMIDFQAYMKVALSMAPMPGYEEMMKAAGVNAKYMFISSACTGDSFEDRYLMVNEGPAQGLVAAGVPAADAPPPLNDMAIQPPNAVLAGVSYMNGAALKTALGDYLGGLKKMMDQMKAQGAPNAVPMPDFDTAIKTFETKTGLKIADLAANVKGTLGYYVVLAPGGVLAPPDIGMFITCADGDKAKAFSDAVSKGFDAYGNKMAVKTVDAPNRKIYQLDLEALGAVTATPAAAPGGINIKLNPYTPCWAVEGNRVFIGSSVQALRKQLSYIDNKTPGLLTQPDFIKAMGALSAEERKGQLVYMDMKSLLTLGATVGLPLLQAKIQDAEIKKNLAALPPAAELFKDIPPLMAASTLQGNQAVSILRSPLPPMQTVLILSIGAGMAMPMLMMQPGGPADAPPGGF